MTDGPFRNAELPSRWKRYGQELVSDAASPEERTTQAGHSMIGDVDMKVFSPLFNELKAHADCPDGIMISVLRAGDSWEFRAAADAATIAQPGYPECVALLVQIGDHLGKQFDVKE